MIVNLTTSYIMCIAMDVAPDAQFVFCTTHIIIVITHSNMNYMYRLGQEHISARNIYYYC